jgi:hypothetical protein
MAYSNFLKIGLAVGFFNLFAIAIRSQFWGDLSISSYWYAASLIAAFPLAILCVWLMFKIPGIWGLGGTTAAPREADAELPTTAQADSPL